MSTKYNLVADINGRSFDGVLPSVDIEGAVMAENIAQFFTVPSEFRNWIAIITASPASNIFVSFTTTAAVYSGAVASVSSVLLPPHGISRQVVAGQSISVITSDTTTPRVCIEYQAVLPYTQNPVQ